MSNYAESNCIVEHNGIKYENHGALVTDDKLYAYIGHKISEKGNGTMERYHVVEWHGKIIGTAIVISKWNIFSYMSSAMYAFKIVLHDGRIYRGRGMGEGMYFTAKRSK